MLFLNSDRDIFFLSFHPARETTGDQSDKDFKSLTNQNSAVPIGSEKIPDIYKFYACQNSLIYRIFMGVKRKII